MSILFDESEFQTFAFSAAKTSSDETSPAEVVESEKDAAQDEKLLIIQYRRLTTDQQRKVLTYLRHMLESSQSAKKVNLLKAIEESKNAPVNENLSDIIKDIVK